MELDLGLALPISSHFPTQNMSGVHNDHHHFHNVKSSLEFKNLMVKDPNKKKKRSFANVVDDGANEEEEDREINKTLSLLVWSGRRPNKGGDEEEDRESRSDMIDGNEEEDEEIVGWPPVRTWRKMITSGGHRRHRSGSGGGGNRNSIFVKVRMEGVMIGRKIDLMLYDSYQSLINSLLNMFAKYSKYHYFN
uniref:Auxin-responsive protein n=1 Tax=Galium aparine TaxID=29788 RepID=A0A896VYQ3_GALAP|nr:IAA14 [Galium aparine]